jgi:hypothetical protein
MNSKAKCIVWNFQNITNKRNIIVLCILVCLVGSAIVCVAEYKKDPKAVVTSFVFDSNQWIDTRIECFYYGWGDIVEFPTSEKDVEIKYAYKAAVRTEAFYYLLNLQKAFKYFKFEKVKIDQNFPNWRLSYVFYKGQQEVLRMTFTDSKPIVLINGQAYQASFHLLKTLMPILPHDAYENVQSFMLNRWIDGPTK